MINPFSVPPSIIQDAKRIMSDLPQSTEIIVQGAEQPMDMSILGHAGQQSLDNFGGDVRHRMKLEMLCQSSDCEPLVDYKGKVIAVKFWYAHPVEIMGDRGEIIEAVRICLITPSGKPFQCVSTGVAKVVAMLAKYFGSAPIDPAETFRIVERPGKRGKFLTLDWIDPDSDVKIDIQ